MHELSIVEALMGQITAVAHENKLKEVHRVELEVGVLRAVIDDVMQVAFQSVIIDTIAQSAELKIVEIKAVAQCLSCDIEFEPQMDNFLCPTCNVANVKVLCGHDIVLKSVEGSKES